MSLWDIGGVHEDVHATWPDHSNAWATIEADDPQEAWIILHTHALLNGVDKAMIRQHLRAYVGQWSTPSDYTWTVMRLDDCPKIQQFIKEWLA